MRCRKCGRELPNDSLFCQYCGVKIEETVSESSDSIAMDPPTRLKGQENENTCSNYGEKIDLKRGQIDRKNVKYNKRIYAFLIASLLMCIIAFVFSGLCYSQLKKQKAIVVEKEDMIIQLSDQKKKLSEQVNRLQTNTAFYNDIRSFTHSISFSDYNKYNKFFASAGVVLVKAGRSETVSITNNHNSDMSFSSSNSHISCSWGEWNHATCPLTIRGLSKGTSILTFTNTWDSSESIHVFVIVTD